MESRTKRTPRSAKNKRRQNKNLTLTPEIASVIVGQVRRGVKITSKSNETGVLNIDPKLLPDNKAIKVDTYRSWIVNRVAPKGAKTPLYDLVQRAKEAYHKNQLLRMLQQAKRVIDEDLNMDTTIKTSHIVNGEVKDIIEISPKLRAIRSKTAMFVAKSIGKRHFNTQNIQIEGDNNTVNVNTISFLQLRERAEDLKRMKEQPKAQSNAIEAEMVKEAEYEEIHT